MPMTATVMAVLLIGIYSTVPQHEAKLRPNGPSNPEIRDGVWEQKDFFGLIDTQWTMRDGMADGDALQYHANGSLFREMAYRAGKLDGLVFEYYEKGPYRRPPVHGRLATPGERRQISGVLKKKMEYREGVADGNYELYYPDGVVREEGIYRQGVKEKIMSYRKDGQPKNKIQAQEEALWTLGR